MGNRMMRLVILGFFCLSGIWASNAYAQNGLLDSLIADVEAGPLYVFQNDGQYGEEGTRFTAEEVGQQRNLLLGRRYSLEWAFANRHRVIFLYAPLEAITTVSLQKNLVFRDTLFPAGTLVSHRYLFDGYRLSYLFDLLSGERVQLGLGASFQIRNAEVSFTDVSGERYATENDIGLVFALKGRIAYTPFDDGPWVMLESDGLSTFGLLGDSVSGAIYDVRLAFGVEVVSGLDLVLGARLLGGGAEVRDKYIDNWGNFGTITLGFRGDLASVLRG